MYEDEVLRELWKTKDALSREYTKDPNAYLNRLREIERAWMQMGEKLAAPRPTRAKKRSVSRNRVVRSGR